MCAAISQKDGISLVKKARESLLSYFEKKECESLVGGVFEQPLSLFVTINSYPKGDLRGCIGFVQTDKKLGGAIREAAVHAGINDTRFEPIRAAELEKVVFEVSVLTPPKLLECAAHERASNIKIGRDGLMIEYGGSTGLLLPQVAIEWNFSAKDFLEALCQKAGLPKDMYKSQSPKIYTFQAQIFAEESPGGKIIGKKLIV